MWCVCGVYGTAGAVCQYASEFKKGVRQVEEIPVNIGELVTSNSGTTNDTRQAVQFTGEKLGEYHEYGTDHHGNITDTRGTTQTLYRVADGRLIVHRHVWSRWVGEPDSESLYVATEKSLQPGGLYARLGAVCGFGHPMTLEEAIGARPPTAGTTAKYDKRGAFVDIGELIESNRARLAATMVNDDEELLDYSSVPFQMFADMTALDVQHAIALFVSTLGAQRWRKGNAPIARLLDALLGVLDEDYFDALEAGHFDTPD